MADGAKNQANQPKTRLITDWPGFWHNSKIITFEVDY